MTVEVRHCSEPACSWSWGPEPKLRRPTWEFGAELRFTWVWAVLPVSMASIIAIRRHRSAGAWTASRPDGPLARRGRGERDADRRSGLEPEPNLVDLSSVPGC